jgi:hypothetical protein
MKRSRSKDSRKASTTMLVAAQRRVQKQTDALDSRKKTDEPKKQKAVQAGAAKEPASPMPRQHLSKPGLESELRPAPRFLASHYRGSGKLEGMVCAHHGRRFRNRSRRRRTFAREGADVAIAYLSEDGDAAATQKHVEKEGRKCVTLRGDVRDMKFCERAVDETISRLGKLDILVNNAAFQEHAHGLEDLTEEHFDLTVRTNLYGYFHMAKAALPHLPKGGSIITRVPRRVCTAASSCSTIPRPRARSTLSRWRWRATWLTAASA